MTQASTQITRQFTEAGVNKKNWGAVAYNVLVEGLVGDGVTDDTSALQTLINAAIADGRRTILFPHGTYYVTALTNADQVDFVGDNSSFVGGYTGTIGDLGGFAELKADFTNSLSAKAGMSQQALFNGNFDIWQRGTSFANPTIGSYTADRWMLGGLNSAALPTLYHDRVGLAAGELPSTYYVYRLTASDAGSGYGANDEYGIFQRVEGGTRYLCGAGKKITVSFYARSNIIGKRLGVSAKQRYGTGGSPTGNETLIGQIITLSGSWVKYSVTIDTNSLTGKTFGTNNDDSLQIQLSYMWGASTAASNFGGGTSENFGGSGFIDIAQVQVCAGDVDLPFQPRNIAEELELCLRTTWIPQVQAAQVRMSTYNANVLVFEVPLPVQLRKTPTIRGTVNTDYKVYNLSNAAQTGFTSSAVLTSNGVRVTMSKAGHGLTDGYLDIGITSGFDAEL